jgi:hypothetical protein
MAALTASVAVNASSLVTDALPAKTSLLGLLQGDAPITLGAGLKAVFVKVTFDGGDYAAGGVDIDLLDSLPGWTAILGCVPGTFTDSVLKIATYDPGTDKVVVNISSTGAEHATAALDGEVNLLVLGY